MSSCQTWFFHRWMENETVFQVFYGKHACQMCHQYHLDTEKTSGEKFPQHKLELWTVFSIFSNPNRPLEKVVNKRETRSILQRLNGLSFHLQYGRFQRQLLVEDLNKKWQRLVLDTLVCSFSFSWLLVSCRCFLFIVFTSYEFEKNSIYCCFTLFLQPLTPLEPCAWLNKFLMEVWCNFLEPKLSKRFRSIVEVSFLQVKLIHVF